MADLELSVMSEGKAWTNALSPAQSPLKSHSGGNASSCASMERHLSSGDTWAGLGADGFKAETASPVREVSVRGSPPPPESAPLLGGGRKERRGQSAGSHGYGRGQSAEGGQRQSGERGMHGRNRHVLCSSTVVLSAGLQRPNECLGRASLGV